jgi:hypothetical protein
LSGYKLYPHHVVKKKVSPNRLEFYYKKFVKAKPSEQVEQIASHFYNRPGLLFQLREKIAQDYKDKKSKKRRAAEVMRRAEKKARHPEDECEESESEEFSDGEPVDQQEEPLGDEEEQADHVEAGA